MAALLAPILALMGSTADDIRRRLTREASILALLAILSVTAFAFLLIAGNAALATLYGPVVAPLLMAAGAILLALLVFLVWQVRSRAVARKNTRKRHDAEVTALITTAALTAIPLILRSSLVKEVGLPLGAALASSLWFRKSDEDDVGHRDRYSR